MVLIIYQTFTKCKWELYEKPLVKVAVLISCNTFFVSYSQSPKWETMADPRAWMTFRGSRPLCQAYLSNVPFLLNTFITSNSKMQKHVFHWESNIQIYIKYSNIQTFGRKHTLLPLLLLVSKRRYYVLIKKNFISRILGYIDSPIDIYCAYITIQLGLRAH